jgi:hypothetical protein
MHRIAINPTHIVHQTQCHACEAARDILPEKYECDGALLVSARNSTRFRADLGLLKRSHTRAAKKSPGALPQAGDDTAPLALITTLAFARV